jgi:DNA-binding CsgD family transcriptional regulator
MQDKTGEHLHGFICIDDAENVLIVSTGAELLAQDFFDWCPRVGAPLEGALSAYVGKVKQRRSAGLDTTSKLNLHKNGYSVEVSLTFDLRGKHCLILESKRELASPSELWSLQLSPRETHVAYWILHRKTNWEIGRILQISTRTVDKHVERIFSKLGVNDRRDVARKAEELCHI